MANSELQSFIDQQQVCSTFVPPEQGSSLPKFPYVFNRTNKTGDTKTFRIRPLTQEDNLLAYSIVEQVNKVPQLAGLTIEGMRLLVVQGLALVAEAQSENEQWVFAAYLGAEALTSEQIGERKMGLSKGFAFMEMRSSLTVTPGYRLNEGLKKIQLINILVKTGLLPCAFTDYIPSWNGEEAIESQAVKINQNVLGLLSIAISHLSPDLSQVFTQPCPANRCVLRGDQSCPACDCKLWYPDVAKL